MAVKLKDDCGMWIASTHDIATKFITDYSERFKSNHRDTRNFMDIQIRQVIVDNVNAVLVNLPNKEEVRQA